MAIKKFYSNKAKAGWRTNPNYKPHGAGKNPAKQSDDEKKFWSWGFDVWLENEKRKRENGFASKQLAENAVSRIRINEKEGKYHLQTRSFPGVTDGCEKRLQRIENARERQRAERVFRVWLGMIPSNLKINEVVPSHIRLYIDLRLKEVKASSVNREVTIIASMLHSAFVDFPELENWNCPRIPRPRVEKSRRERLITAEETIKVLTYLLSPRRDDETIIEARNRRRVGLVFRVALLTGARIGEITAMRWEHINFSARVMQIVGTKTRFRTARNVRYLELIDTIREIFTELLGEPVGEYVFSQTGNSITHYYEIMKKACAAVGVKYGRSEMGGFVTHDARHTAVTRMLQAGVDLSTVGAITGHSDNQLILHYSHATRDSRRKAIEVLENVMNETERESAPTLPEGVRKMRKAI